MSVNRRSIVLKTGSVAAVVALAATACGSSKSSSSGASGSGSGSAANTINTANVNTGGKVTWTIEKTVDAWNPLSGSGNTFDYVQVLNPILPSPYITNPDYTVSLNTDLLAGEPTYTVATATAPQTIVYKIQPNAVWSDGTPITADDFIYAWQAQSNPNLDVASNSGYVDIASVVGSDNGKTVTVTWKQGKSFPAPDWKGLFGTLQPEHIAKQHGDLAASWAWTIANPPPVSGGQFEIAPNGVAADKSTVTLIRNPKYYGTPAKLDTVVFRSITDATQEPTALANKEVDGIYPQPELDLVNQINQIAGVTTHMDSGLQYEHIDLNLKNTALGNATWGGALRTAMFTAFDRQGLINRTIKQFDSAAAPLNNRMFVPGQKGYQDNLTQFGLGSGDVAKAKSELTAAGFTGVGTKLVEPGGTPVPAFSMRYTAGNAIRQNTCNLFAQAMQQLGITVNVTSTDSLGKTLTQADAQHQYDIIVFAWVATPFFATANQALYTTAPAGSPGSNYGYYSNPQVDQWLAGAAGTSDEATQISDLNQADTQISKDAYTLPLYQKPTLIAFRSNLGNIRNNTTSAGPTYNIQQWGIKAAAS